MKAYINLGVLNKKLIFLWVIFHVVIEIFFCRLKEAANGPSNKWRYFLYLNDKL
ncbi:hypothetical protein NIASO_15855 [Niabella soli DSM 19437]|uniref:Uncharacterized protein n=1 Tax=Niabella soli DSM 19437 TaxID=929713 RepID=W0F4D3_9BACT|nr:hypothetical protein NIASO_15855 [Niabella soli DSM 19437]